MTLSTCKMPCNYTFFYVSPEPFSVIKSPIKSSIHNLFVYSRFSREQVTVRPPIMYSLGTGLVVLIIISQILRVPVKEKKEKKRKKKEKKRVPGT